ncbi:group II intron reverse transcriptase/maturase [Burkholderia sp. Bp8963]|uniref:group II intron reverse transcriptase/maturase n=1 Tax=Burkholderia sp. Bp8963 TaxID=2184547 RepID=UPI000F5982CC|nr:group II intron reverse transcriptase/maturase [Burkholderia sp. Bp8963]RQS76980.1 group II intron reverse transcriptase/maturase [Burkholderia sp. Bp8963]
MNGQSTCALADQGTSWHSIDWNTAHAAVKRMQARIVKATQDGRWNRVKALQRLLTTSFYSKALAVKRVTENQGKRTPGVDRVLWSTPDAKYMAIGSLKRCGYQPLPLKRIYIPKSNGKLRPLSIPTMRDRAMQALYLLALDPVSETISDVQSYGFRKERSTHDAIAQCFMNARYHGNPKDRGARVSAQWILEADIRGCFDNIDHAWLLKHVPTDKAVLAKWLRAGYLKDGAFARTTEGTPQGGIISPVLANFALNGLDKALSSAFKNASQRIAHKVNLVRYADDFVITGVSREVLQDTITPAVTAFLASRGLELAPEKTKITHLTEGYDFLGQNVRRYGKKLLIKPARKNVQSFLLKARDLIRRLRSAPQDLLIRALNPVITGWAMYHRHVVAQETFSNVDSHIWYALWQWAKRRHPKKPPEWVRQRYFHQIGLRRWVFAAATDQMDDSGRPLLRTLRTAASIPIERHPKVQSDANPYDREWYGYFAQRAAIRSRASRARRKGTGRS